METMKISGITLLSVATVLLWTGCITDEDTKTGNTPDGIKTTVYDNFGADWASQFDMGWSLSGKDGGNNSFHEQAMAFIPPKDGVLSDVWVALSYGTMYKAKSVTFKLASDRDGLPGEVLESWVVDTGFVYWGTKSSPHHLKGSGKTGLVARKRYWLWATPEDSTYVAWNFQPKPEFTCPHTMRTTGDWYPVGMETCSVFRVDIIEPAAP
jgi:hypothetical protein